jgi:hypothetical protein
MIRLLRTGQPQSHHEGIRMSDIEKNPEQTAKTDQPIEPTIDDLPNKVLADQDAQAVKGGGGVVFDNVGSTKGLS